MAANRPTLIAPHSLTRLSKTTLADMTWALACEVATHVKGSTCSPEETLRVIEATAQIVKAPGQDLGRLGSLLETHDPLVKTALES